MAFVFKASLFGRGRQLIMQSSGLQKECILLHTYTKTAHKSLSQTRLYSKEDGNLTSEKKVRVYEGTLGKKIRFVKTFSLATSLGSILCQPYLISRIAETGNRFGIAGVVVVFGFFAYVTPVLLHFITKRYVVYVDYNPNKDTYTATTYSFFVRKKEVDFKPKDVQLPNISEMLTSCFIKGQPMFMDVTLFSDIDHYKRIMGFDKPIDFRLDAEDVSTKKD